MLTLLIMCAISYRSLVISRESELWVVHTHEVLENLQNLTIAMRTVEAIDRGFALTGDESSLKPYHAFVLNAERYQAAIGVLTADNPAQQRRLPLLKSLVSQKIEFGATMIRLRHTKGFEAAADEIRSNRGQRIMDALNGVVDELRREEQRLLAQRDEDSKRRLGQAKTVLILGSIVGLLIVVAAVWGLHRESSARGLAQKALRQSEEQFRGLLEAAPDAMVVMDRSGEIVLLNAQAERQFGYRRDELLGQKMQKIIPASFTESRTTDEKVHLADALVLQSGTEIELDGRRKDGSEFPIEIVLGPLQSAEGILVTAAIRNITLRKKSEELLATTIEDLKRSNAELEQMAFVSSHDLQEPLRTVASYAQLLAKRYKGSLDPNADEFIAYIVDGCVRMKTC